MKLIKVLSVLVVCFVILSNSFLIGYAADVSEPDPDEVIMYGLTHAELLEYGYLYFGDGAYGLSEGVPPIETMLPSLLLDTSKRYPSFNPAKLPWLSAPSYIKDIVYMDLSGAQTLVSYDYRMPFVCVRVTGSGVDVFVGLNIGLGYASSSGAVRICYIAPAGESYGTYPLYHCCYKASFDRSYNMTSNWTTLTASSWGDTGYIKTYNSSTLFDDSWNADIYLYGGNGIRTDTSSGVLTTVSQNSTSSAKVTFPLNNLVGFGSRQYFTNQSSFTDVYVETFSPVSLAEVQKDLIEEGNSILEEQNQLIEEGLSRLDEQNQLIEDGNELERDENDLIEQGNDLLQNQNDLLEEANSRLDAQNGIERDENVILQEGNSILRQQNDLIDAGNALLNDIKEALSQSGDSDLSTTLPDDSFSDFNDAESGLVDDYNPDNLEDDLNIDLNSSAMSFIWDLFDRFITVDSGIFTLFISIMAVGIIALILGR